MTFKHKKSYLQARFLILNENMFGGMMIRCHLSRLMGEHKLKVVDVARQTGLHRNTITLLYNETAARVDLDAIEKLCALFGVEVGELFERVQDGEAQS